MHQSLITEQIIRRRLLNLFPSAKNVRLQPVGGGSINDCYQISFTDSKLFCKVNSATKFPHLFQKESNGLKLIAAQGIITSPTVLDLFQQDNKQYLFLQWVEEGERTEGFWKSFGEKLAMLHRVTNEQHGWDETNYMGSVPQANTFYKNWCSFFAAERLAPMAAKCAAKGLLTNQLLSQLEALEKKLPDIFEEEAPSLLHGDLWSGNFMCNRQSEPVLIDPAIYFGHRSIDLAMTTMFGGFSKPFYEAYHYHFPFPANYKEQWAVCNLYPLLIHLYLFGTGYLPQIQNTLKQFA